MHSTLDQCIKAIKGTLVGVIILMFSSVVMVVSNKVVGTNFPSGGPLITCNLDMNLHDY